MEKKFKAKRLPERFSHSPFRCWAAWAIAICMLLVLWGTTAIAKEQKAEGWKFSVTPYLWYPSFSSTMRYTGSGGEPGVEAEQDSSTELNFAFMVGAEAGKGAFSILTDVIYLDLNSESGSITSVDFPASGNEVDVNVDTDVETNLKGLLWSVGGGVLINRSKSFEIGGIFGLRYLGLEAETKWKLESDVTDPDTGEVLKRSGSVSGRDDIWDLILGFRGRVNLGKSGLFIPYYIDIGTWTSYLTSQGILGLGYAFSWGELMLDYRYLYYEFYSSQVMQDLVIQGPALGVKFKF